jgi:hypothetical protein
MNSLEEYQFRNRHPYQMQGWLDNILGINVEDTLKKAGQSAVDQAKTTVLSTIASSDKVQQAAKTAAEQAAAKTLATQIVENKKAIMYGGIALAGLVLILLLRK